MQFNTALLIILITVFFIFTVVLLILLVFMLRKRLTAGAGAETLENISIKLNQLETLTKGVEDLSDIFLIPHTRGGIGETLLEELLKNWLPKKSFSLQYAFKNGTRVDAVIRLGKNIIPIDSKFPLESLKRFLKNENRGKPLPGDVKKVFRKYVEEISRKYIRPEEGTLQFALLYIPSERIYYHAFAEADNGLVEESLRLGIIPVSPSTLFLYIQTAAYGLRGLNFSERQKEITALILQLRTDFTAFTRQFTLTGNHLRNLQKSYEDSFSRFNKLDMLLQRIEEP